MGSSDFARRYFRNHGCFLFLSLLRCFSSGGSPRTPMDSVHGTGFLSRWVAPFRYLRIIRYLLLPAAFRSLSRLSSALSAKASTLRSCSLVLRRRRLRSCSDQVNLILTFTSPRLLSPKSFALLNFRGPQDKPFRLVLSFGAPSVVHLLCFFLDVLIFLGCSLFGFQGTV